MSIYTDMITVQLFVNEPKPSKSGADKQNFVHVEDIEIAIYKNDSFKSIQNAKYEQSTHNALTFYKGFEEGKEYRLMIGSTPMEITYFNTTGRFTTLLLKELITYG